MSGIIDFQKVFGVPSDRNKLTETPLELRFGEILRLVEKMNDEFVPYNLSKQEAINLVNEAYASFLAIHAPDKEFTPLENSRPPLDIRILYPYCRGFYAGKKPSVMTKEGDLNTPTVAAHEFSHVMGHYSEIEAEVLGYIIPKQSGIIELQRSADLLRLSRQAWATGTTEILDCDLREEIKEEIRHSRSLTPYQSLMMKTAPIFLSLLLKRAGSKSSDYREGFTDFLYTAGIDIN